MFIGFDYLYVVLVLPVMLLALLAQLGVSGTFNKYSKVRNARGMTGAQAAQAVLRLNGVNGVRIERVSGRLTDHYDPRQQVIRLSDGVYDSTSVAAVGVAAHEAGHAAQYAHGYGPIRLRTAIIPVCQIGSQLSFPLLLAGIFLNSYALIDVGILLFMLAAVFQIVTLPVEFNASSRAMDGLHDAGVLARDELAGARRTLNAAAWTYVAALAVSLAQLFRLLILFGGGRRRRG